ncbi:MAG: hypothetical protein AABX29_08280 [Nanoarchaeota archaeon]
MDEKGIGLRNFDIKASVHDKKRGIHLPNRITSDLAYLCGVLAGDGCIIKKEYRIICVGNPRDEIEFYDFIISSLFKKIFNLDIKPQVFKYAGTYGIRFSSKLIALFLIEYIGLPHGKKYNKLCVPSLFKNDKKLFISYLSGLFDTDFGFTLKKDYFGIKRYPAVCFTTKSKKFCFEIYTSFRKLGMNPNKVYKCSYVHKKTNKEYFWYRFDLPWKTNFLLLNKILRYRHPKHIKKLKEWTKINKGNLEIIKFLRENCPQAV